MESVQNIVDLFTKLGNKCIGNVSVEYHKAKSNINSFVYNIDLSPKPTTNSFDTDDDYSRKIKYRLDPFKININQSPRRKNIENITKGNQLFHNIIRQCELSIHDEMKYNKKHNIEEQTYHNSLNSSADEHEYRMSDWENEDPMKTEDVDLECDEIDGQIIPPWARVELLDAALKYQNEALGDDIFADLNKQCVLAEVFNSKNMLYHERERTDSQQKIENRDGNVINKVLLK